MLSTICSRGVSALAINLSRGSRLSWSKYWTHRVLSSQGLGSLAELWWILEACSALRSLSLAFRRLHWEFHRSGPTA